MFQHIIDDVYIINQSALPASTNGVLFVDWFKDVSHGYHWKEYREFFPGMSSILKITAAIVGAGEKVVVLPDEDFHKFLMEYCQLLRLDDESVESLYIYNNACSLYSEGYRKYSDTKGIMDKKPFSMKKLGKKEDIDIDFDRFPLEFAVNCLNQEWARRKFELMRSQAIYRTVKEIQFLAMRDASMGPREFQDISGNKEKETQRLLLADVRFPVLDGLDRVGFNTESYRKPIELYVEELPDFGINASEAFRFNYLLAKHIKETGYRIDVI